MKRALSVGILLLTAAACFAESPLGLDLSFEAGFIGILKHEIQSGTDADRGDVFDYKTQGGQDVLFPVTRLAADLILFQRHHAIFMYQPLVLETQVPVSGSFRYDQVDYDDATDGFLDLVYSFSFWRFSYLYDIFQPPGYTLSAGISMQIRNADIVFRESESGKGSRTSDIGPVPIIKLKTGYYWEGGVFVEFEGDGFYASNAFFNGADYPFTGYIYDLSLRGGYRFQEFSSAYLNLRFLGGGGQGVSDDLSYTYNDLHTIGASLGLILHL